jgi:hypothetical protein
LKSGLSWAPILNSKKNPRLFSSPPTKLNPALGIVAWAVELVQIDRGATARVEGPLTGPAREFPHELEIESGERDVIPEPDLDVRLEDEPFH